MPDILSIKIADSPAGPQEPVQRYVPNQGYDPIPTNSEPTPLSSDPTPGQQTDYDDAEDYDDIFEEDDEDIDGIDWDTSTADLRF